MRVCFLLDHENIPFQAVTVADIVEQWLDSRSAPSSTSELVHVLIRAYGGWFEEQRSTRARFLAADFYQTSCPSVFRHGRSLCKLSFEFADFLAPIGGAEHNRPPIRITHSLVTRSSPQVLNLRTPQIQCNEDGCQLRVVRQWLRRRRACSKPHCPHAFSDVFMRREQKQVDVHLAVDLMLLAVSQDVDDYLVVVSDHSDLTPALAAAGSDRMRSYPALCGEIWRQSQLYGRNASKGRCETAALGSAASNDTDKWRALCN